MLLNFQVSNFRSLRDPATLSLSRVGKRPKGVAPEDWNPVSSIMAIFGSNASGKSTVYEAVRTVQNAVRDSYTRWEPDSPVPVMPFLLDPEFITEPTEFSTEFRASDGLEYVYGFSCDQTRILTENLYVYKSAHRTVLFERGLGDDIDEIRFGPSFKGKKAELKEAVKSRPNALTLSAGAQIGASSQLVPAHLWLTHGLQCYDSAHWDTEHMTVMRNIATDPDFKKTLLAVLSKADLGINGIEVKETAMPLNMNFSELLVGGSDGLRFGPFRLERKSNDNPRPVKREIVLSHRSSTGSTPFPMAWESQGTKSFLALISKCLVALGSGGTVIVDEIDASLHSVLTAEIIELFKSRATNPFMAQLIFTTHDVSLLSKGTAQNPLLDRDQIYFVEKDRNSGSHLIALTEYTPRKEENIERGYLLGRFGGIPNPHFMDYALAVANPNKVS
ncbi:ATP-binding protein [Pseudarthrobacter sp. efr-133-R2A-89]|uniref:AAA family ATPase n=1 Tax=Pseudarthrobacter sp. efr-133-R2A-89 TaxID=3040302 RepID=UPI0025570106|nr:ATP-binding protein [Pseudarthrobacter sp. efr-133-R2A-89]